MSTKLRRKTRTNIRQAVNRTSRHPPNPKTHLKGFDAASDPPGTESENDFGYKTFSVHHAQSRPKDYEGTDVQAPSSDASPPSNKTITTGSSMLSPSNTSVSQSSEFTSHAPNPTFVPLPPLKTLNLTEAQAEMAPQHSTAPNSTISSVSLPSSPAQPIRHTTTNHHTATIAIITLSVAGGVVLLIAFVVIRLIRRPRWRKMPTPSLPILQHDTFPDEKGEADGSPVFGGKECYSPSLRNAKGDLWTWTQYQSGIPKPAPTVTITRSTSEDVSRVGKEHETGGSRNQQSSAQWQDQNLLTGTGSGAPKCGTTAAPLQPIQNAITRAVSRLSTISMSLYPNSPNYSQIGSEVGLAIDALPNEEHDGQRKRTESLRSRSSMLAPASTNARDAAVLRRSQSFAYGGMQIGSNIPNATDRQPNGGRARIKSTYYTPGCYPRASNGAARRNMYEQGHDYEQHHQPSHSVQRSDSQRGRETQALKTVLGLGSPIPPSPQPTLYPDDSMSVIEEAKKITVIGRSHKKPIPKQATSYEQADESTDTAALGSLMMVDFSASTSKGSLVNIRPCEAARERQRAGETGSTPRGTAPQKASLKKRVEDKPPRVPSPPPLPSLAQMALNHANPDAYADYHSPTYSIYGLYDGDRKSRVTSFGG